MDIDNYTEILNSFTTKLGEVNGLDIIAILNNLSVYYTLIKYNQFNILVTLAFTFNNCYSLDTF